MQYSWICPMGVKTSDGVKTSASTLYKPALQFDFLVCCICAPASCLAVVAIASAHPMCVCL